MPEVPPKLGPPPLTSSGAGFKTHPEVPEVLPASRGERLAVLREVYGLLAVAGRGSVGEGELMAWGRARQGLGWTVEMNLHMMRHMEVEIITIYGHITLDSTP